jgi:hypothetical protein
MHSSREDGGIPSIDYFPPIGGKCQKMTPRKAALPAENDGQCGGRTSIKTKMPEGK